MRSATEVALGASRRRGAPARRLGGLVLAFSLLVGFLPACTEGKSFVVVRLLPAAGQTIPGVAAVRLELSTGLLSDTLTYASRPSPTFDLLPTREVTLSVSFSDALTGNAVLGAAALDGSGTVLGYGEGIVKIAPGREAFTTVLVEKGKLPPAETDAGAADGASPDATNMFPDLTCTPASANACGTNATCGVSCKTNGDPASQCVAAGAKQPGELCSPGECAPGSQCFSDTCGVRVCRRFCDMDIDCPTGGSCFTEIICADPPRPTGVRICSQPCDPLGEAKVGCATGLRCFVYPGEVTDCDCVAPERTKGDGAPCTDSSSCLPGLACITMGGVSSCRPLCRLNAPGTCAQGRTCERLTNPDYNVFGACVP